LARVQETRTALAADAAPFGIPWANHDAALRCLWIALDAEPVRAHPVPVGDEDEATRMPGPHRFSHPHGGHL
jgi:hypothetical protein